ncbi:DDB1- and CUL4-associated factor 16 isoform X2 [Ovis aries]|uniref:DDB1- and CUL4-associated factor 16 isoform X2 n=1 Tax=Ovis aries TaxID=9940 RepID=UPI00295275EB|nr:DDB1- and CUL4-associated factor 16 isoform X2 [Ovis aries]
MAPVPGRDEACSRSPTAGQTDQGPHLHWEADSRGRGYRQSFQTTPAGEGNTARLPRDYRERVERRELEETNPPPSTSRFGRMRWVSFKPFSEGDLAFLRERVIGSPGRDIRRDEIAGEESADVGGSWGREARVNLDKACCFEGLVYKRACCLVAKSCPTLRDPRDCGPPGCSVRGISQARILKWVAISSSTGSSPPWDLTRISCFGWREQLSHQGSPTKSSHSQVKATFADGPATKSPVSKGICTIYGKHRILAHQTDPWQLILPSPCTKVTAPADKEGNH